MAAEASIKRCTVTYVNAKAVPALFASPQEHTNPVKVKTFELAAPQTRRRSIQCLVVGISSFGSPIDFCLKTNSRTMVVISPVAPLMMRANLEL